MAARCREGSRSVPAVWHMWIRNLLMSVCGRKPTLSPLSPAKVATEKGTGTLAEPYQKVHKLVCRLIYSFVDPLVVINPMRINSREARSTASSGMLVASIIAVGSIFSLLSSCAHTVDIMAPNVIPVIAPSSLRVVVVYDSSIVDHHCIASKGYIADEWVIELGPATIAAFTPAFSAIFSHVEFVQTDRDVRTHADTNIIRLSLDSYTGCEATWPIVDQPIAIVYSADIYRGSDKVLSDWTGAGIAAPEDLVINHTSARDEANYLGYMTTLAIRRALAEILWKFEENEEVLAWKASTMPGPGVR